MLDYEIKKSKFTKSFWISFQKVSPKAKFLDFIPKTIDKYKLAVRYRTRGAIILYREIKYIECTTFAVSQSVLLVGTVTTPVAYATEIFS